MSYPMEYLPLELILEIANYLEVNTLYNICLINKSFYNILYGYFIKKNNIEKEILQRFINYINPDKIRIITNPKIIKTRISYDNNKYIILDTYTNKYIDEYIDEYICKYQNRQYQNRQYQNRHTKYPVNDKYLRITTYITFPHNT